MNILHIWNTAAIPSILSKYLRRNGVISDVIARRVFDKYGFEEVYGNYTTTYDVSATKFYRVALQKASDYDVIHVHSIDKLVPLMKIRQKKPVLLHYHGTDIRGKGSSFVKRVYRRFANITLVSTPDLLTDLPIAVYLPNPVDLDLFKPTRQRLHSKGKAVFFLKYPDTRAVIDTVNKIAERMGLNLEIYDRRYQSEFISYEDLPELYNSFEYFIDRIILKDLSKMALEALACGVKVIKDNNILTNLPRKHDPYQVSKKMLHYYEQLLSH
jgi:hypothetical protein